MVLAVTRNPVDWVFCALVTVGVVAGVVAGRRSPVDPWREAVLTDRARAAGSARRARRRARWAWLRP